MTVVKCPPNCSCGRHSAISEANKTRVWSKSSRNKISYSLRGNQRLRGKKFPGKIISEENKIAIRRGVILRNENSSWKESIREAALRRYQDPKQRELLRSYGLIGSKVARSSKPTNLERILFNVLATMYGPEYLKREFPILQYNVDIAIPSLMLVFEADGEYWHKGREEYDFLRQSRIEDLGWKVFRIQESRIKGWG